MGCTLTGHLKTRSKLKLTERGCHGEGWNQSSPRSRCPNVRRLLAASILCPNGLSDGQIASKTLSPHWLGVPRWENTLGLNSFVTQLFVAPFLVELWSATLRMPSRRDGLNMCNVVPIFKWYWVAVFPLRQPAFYFAFEWGCSAQPLMPSDKTSVLTLNLCTGKTMAHYVTGSVAQ